MIPNLSSEAIVTIFLVIAAASLAAALAAGAYVITATICLLLASNVYATFHYVPKERR